jgi:hypothetical protein
MWETTFDYDANTGLEYKAHRELRAGGLTGSEVPDIHQLGPDVSGRDLVTIHIYAPPLGVLKTYKLGSSTIDLYTPERSRDKGPFSAPAPPPPPGSRVPPPATGASQPLFAKFVVQPVLPHARNGARDGRFSIQNRLALWHSGLRRGCRG